MKVGGVKMTIKDIKRVHLVEEEDPEEQEEAEERANASPKEHLAYEELKNKLFEGLN